MKNNFVVFLLLVSAELYAQGTTLHQNLYWLRFQNQIIFSNKLSWYNEVDNRRFFHPDVQNQLIAHSHIHYTIKNFEPAIGGTLSWQYTQDPETKTAVVIPEIRPFQELNYALPFSKKLELRERLRIDERFIRNHTATELTEGYDFIFRFRLRSQLNYNLKNNYVIKLSDEIMFNDRRNTFDQNRVTIALEKKLSKNFSVEVSYIHIYQMRSNNKGYYSREVARLSINYKIVTKKNEA